MLRRGVFIGIAAMLMGASLVFTWSASAHDVMGWFEIMR